MTKCPNAAGRRNDRSDLYLCEKEELSMKKLTAILLSLVLALSLTVPALAAPVDGAYTVDGEPVPVYKPGEALGVIGGADGPTAITTTGPAWLGGLGVDLSAFNSLFTTVNSSVERVPTEEYLAGHPGLEEELKANAYDYFAQEYGEYWTVEEYMESFGMTEEDFLDDMVQIQVSRLVSAEAAQAAINTQKEALGGVPGQVGVMVNGTYIKFPDAAPEAADDRTMVPVRALVEALGGEVDYEFADQKDSVRLFIDKYTINFTIGGTTAVRHTRGTDTGEDDKTIEMDCAPYIKDGCTYVPVRFLAEALGYEVGWDPLYQTVVLLDRAALAAEIDQDFTILNKVQANKGIGMEEGRNYRADMKGAVSLTFFDTLNGSKTYKADLTAKQLFNTEAASADISLKLSDNAMEALDQLLTSQLGADYEEDAALFRTVAEGLEDMELILTRDGSVWFRMAALDELAGTDNVWLDFDLGEEMGELAFTQAGDTTIGSVLTQMMPCESVTEWGSVMEMVELMGKLYGDDEFTTSGGTSTLTIGLDDLFDLYKDMGLSEDDIEEAKAAFKEYKIVMKVDSKGGADVAIVMETKAQVGVPSMKVTMDVKQSAGNVTMNMNFHIANLGEVKVDLTQTQKTTTDKPLSEPPEGSTLVDVDNGAELLIP